MDLGEKLATMSGLVSVDSQNMPEVREFVKNLGLNVLDKMEIKK